jgi:hypothetical protein
LVGCEPTQKPFVSCLGHISIFPRFGGVEKVIIGEDLTKTNLFIINFIGHDLAIIIMCNSLFKDLCGINTYAIHLLVLFEHRCHVLVGIV